ncbi:MAG: cation diffusion facilitator family transporter [Armatimonadota bacterium]|nr:cation diffusion facilitator family transporter [Armatimonadota bacterium]MDR7485945.1 cation diffusion facilitator family transporter [Armatimonadota bacterium]MDR7532177.1 cation diffusion facilitator family transporter [Armatimonadota bacterium]MDR7537287.1 cation diffusion facilitator family transporter [Armatimonadota bacterium]
MAQLASTPPVKIRAALVSVATGLAILGFKVAAYLITGSVALLSDAAESVVNVVAANVALASIVVAVRPPDQTHPYGHAKAEYVSSATEGALIGVAGGWVVITAVRRLLRPQPLQQLPVGFGLLGLATVANLAVALFLLRISRVSRSIALEASARHLLSDVLTSVGVAAGLGLATVTGWAPLDALTALVVGGHIVWMGIVLVRRSVAGLMDAQLPPHEVAKVHDVFEAHRSEVLDYHALRTRQAGADRFVDVHLVVHRSSTVQEAHALTDDLEQHIREALPGVDVTIHVEPCDASCARCAAVDAARRRRVPGPRAKGPGADAE